MCDGAQPLIVVLNWLFKDASITGIPQTSNVFLSDDPMNETLEEVLRKGRQAKNAHNRAFKRSNVSLQLFKLCYGPL